jgi:CheY-like chemotaxis protein
VLVVDDCDDTRELYQVLLVDAGFAVDSAADGLAAISCVERDAPSVIVTDLGLPDGGGLALCRELRSRPASVSIPIVVVTGHAGAKEKALLAGASHFLAKPVDPDLLLAVVREAATSGPPH